MTSSSPPPKARFTGTYQLLEQEALLVQSCLCTGLTALRNANLHDKGMYYTAFFQLCIGIERMSKLALILDYMGHHQLRAPGKLTMKKYGHDLDVLFGIVGDLSQERGHDFKDMFLLPPLAGQILSFLSEFAKGLRYANLDNLATGSAGKNPLLEWDRILQIAIATKVPEPTKMRHVTRSTAIGQIMEQHSLVIASDLANQPLTVTESLYKPAVADEAAKYIILEIITTLAPLRDFIAHAGGVAMALSRDKDRGAMNVPYMSEFFTFIWLDRNYILRKKRWP